MPNNHLWFKGISQVSKRFILALLGNFWKVYRPFVRDCDFEKAAGGDLFDLSKSSKIFVHDCSKSRLRETSIIGTNNRYLQHTDHRCITYHTIKMANIMKAPVIQIVVMMHEKRMKEISENVSLETIEFQVKCWYPYQNKELGPIFKR